MTIRTILKMGDPRLLRVAQPVTAFDTPALHQLVNDMRETMQAVNGAGLAAPQIGEDWQVVIFGSGERNPRYPDRPIVPPTVLINPVITPLGAEEEDDWEGCLSVPGVYDGVERAAQVHVKALDRHGQSRVIEAEGLLAVCLQHEMDHLRGKVFVEYLSPLKRTRIKSKMVKAQRELAREQAHVATEAR